MRKVERPAMYGLENKRDWRDDNCGAVGSALVRRQRTAAEAPKRPSKRAESFEHARVSVLGAPVSVITMGRAVATISDWIRSDGSRYVCVADVHSIVRAVDDVTHAEALAAADMVTPDGAPVFLVGKLKAGRDIGRVSGPDLMLELCAKSVEFGWRHYFLGGAEGVAEQLASDLTRAYPGLQIAGFYSPPFRNLTADEDAEVLASITASRADILWVGLGCPKQERWMFEHRNRLPVPVTVGVGAAFDFHSGRVTRAPRWMRRIGLEWLHRLASEPRRLWKRYLLLGPRFVWLSVSEALRPNAKAQADLTEA